MLYVLLIIGFEFVIEKLVQENPHYSFDGNFERSIKFYL